MTDFTARLEQTKRKLLDLTKRNKLINYRRPSKTKNLKIIDESAKFIYQHLVVEEKSFKFKYIPEPEIEKIIEPVIEDLKDVNLFDDSSKEVSEQLKASEENILLTAEEQAKKLGFIVSSELPEINLEEENVEDKYIDEYLQTLHYPTELEKILKKIELNARSIIEESGTNMLYLVLGVLEWHESKNSEVKVKSPLINIPVILKRGARNKHTGTYEYVLQYTGEDIETNESLAHKLKNDFALHLPELTEELTFSDYMTEVYKICEIKKGWKIKHEIALDFLHFGKILMYKDLNNIASLEDNPLLQDLFLGKEVSGVSYAPNEYDIDNHDTAQRLPLVLDADSSQHSAIVDVIEGKNIVIEGPPGTGKSQTITNIIACLMAEGKSVLFVSEKLAALEVVNKRLSHIGLGDFCLELHSHKSNKTEVLKSLETRLKGNYPEFIDIQNIQSSLNNKKQQLQEYLDLLHTIFGKIQISIHDIFWLVEKYSNTSKYLKFDIENSDEITQDILTSNIDELKKFISFRKNYDFSNTYWTGYALDKLSFIDIDKFIEKLNALNVNYKKLSEQFEKLTIEVDDQMAEMTHLVILVDNFQTSTKENLKQSDLKIIYQNFDVFKKYIGYRNNIGIINSNIKNNIVDYQSLSPEDIKSIMTLENLNGIKELLKYKDFSDLINDDFNQEVKSAENLYHEVEKTTLMINKIFNLEKISNVTSIENLIEKIEKNKDSLFRFFNSSYKEARKEYSEILNGELPKDSNEWINNLNNLVKYLKLKEDFEIKNRTLFVKLNFDWHKLYKLGNWAKSIKNNIAEKLPTDIKNKYFDTDEYIYKILSFLNKQNVTMENCVKVLAERDGLLSKIKTVHQNITQDLNYSLDNVENLKHSMIYATYIRENKISDNLKSLLLDDFDKIMIQFKTMHKIYKEIETVNQELLVYGKINKSLFYQNNQKKYLEYSKKLDMVKDNKDNLSTWLDYSVLVAQLQQKGLEKTINAVDEMKIPLSEIINNYKYNLYHSLLKKAFKTYALLNTFNRLSHEEVIKSFKSLDKELLALNKKKVISLSSHRVVPYGYSGGSVKELTEQRLLEHEIGKKKRHIPIRQLIKRSAQAIQGLKPCFMMSPLSIAQYLSPEHISFDVLVVDEASQLRPEEALGAIARAKQIVIVGDPKQLPPTSFFDTLRDDEKEEETILDEAESILDTCIELYRPVRRLRWHYRSQHETLIEFSNKHFYDNDLIIFPSPSHVSNDELGVKYTYVENAIYQSGTSLRINKLEAKKVVEFIERHIEKQPNYSLGIGTFNTAQRDLIQQMVDEKEKSNPLVENYLAKWQKSAEPFFIKNLESLQGDERDEIIISTTFGQDSITRKVQQRFGPINQAAGWRRLNVLITRAKKKMHVVTSLKSDDIIVGENTSKGVRDLRGFLKYLETQKLTHEPIVNGDKGFDSHFEESVYQILDDSGIQTVPQVGVAGYFIDLSVLSKNSNNFILGIECDGATYHSSKSARDRDRLKQDVLENLGWNIYRIWSVDWYKNRENEIKKLLSVIDELQNKYDNDVKNVSLEIENL